MTSPPLTLSPPRSLIQRWWATAAVYTIVITLAFVWLQGTDWGFANRWLLLSVLAAAVELALLRRHLHHNHRPHEAKILPTFGLGNTISIFRGLLLAMLAGFLFSPQPWGALAWFPVLLYTTSDILDAVDGYAARRTDHMTRLGETLDMEYDSLGIGTIVLLAIGYGSFPWWFIIIALARYVFMAAVWWRKKRDLPVHPLTVSGFRRVAAGYLMGMLSVSIWPVVPPEAMTLGGLVYLIVTQLIFWRDWLVVSGRLDPTNPRYIAMRRMVYKFVHNWLPLLLRPLIFALLLSTGMLSYLAAGHPAWVDYLHSDWLLPFSQTAAVALGWASLIWGACVLFGIQARWIALLMLLPTAVQIGAVGLGWQSGLLLVAILLVSLTNSGRYSLWRPREAWAHVPPGREKRG